MNNIVSFLLKSVVKRTLGMVIIPFYYIIMTLK